MTGDGAEETYFQKNIRKFNSGMAMASLTVNDATINRGGPGAFKILGQMYRRMGPMLNNEDRQPSCLQVYFYDPELQAEMRADRFPGANSNIEANHTRDVNLFSRLLSILQECGNSYLLSFKTVKEFVESYDVATGEVSIELHATDKPTNGQHRERYHLPTAPEI